MVLPRFLYDEDGFISLTKPPVGDYGPYKSLKNTTLMCFYLDDQYWFSLLDLSINEKIEYSNIKDISKIKFQDNFNKDINLDNIPETVKLIKFGKDFNQKLDHLPNSLEELILGENFNQKLDHLPNKLKYLKLGNNFNQKLDHLPNKLKYLKLGNNFDQKIDFLPNNLKELTLGENFNQSLKFLPKSLKKLYLSKKYLRTLPKNILDHLEIIRY